MGKTKFIIKFLDDWADDFGITIKDFEFDLEKNNLTIAAFKREIRVCLNLTGWHADINRLSVGTKNLENSETLKDAVEHARSQHLAVDKGITIGLHASGLKASVNCVSFDCKAQRAFCDACLSLGPLEILSIPDLIATLLEPWRLEADETPVTVKLNGKSFDLQELDYNSFRDFYKANRGRGAVEPPLMTFCIYHRYKQN